MDEPIESAQQDLFGFRSFGEALAKAIAETLHPSGTVVALSGAWGSGKTSIIETYVVPVLKARSDITIARFDPWAAIEGRDLIVEYLATLRAALSECVRRRTESTLSAIAREAVPFLRDVATAMVPGLGGLIGRAGEAAARRGIESASAYAERLLAEKPLGQRLEDLRGELRGTERRIVFIVDDLDRLPPEELLLVFCLLRTIGRLPNVVHLLAIDRAVAERVVSERFPAEGPSYLEKIVQAWFEVPGPTRQGMANAAADVLRAVGGLSEEDVGKLRADPVFYNSLVPLLQTPRDLRRLQGVLALIWPALRGQVHLLDLAALEALKLRYPATYREIATLCSQPERREGLGVDQERDREILLRRFRLPQDVDEQYKLRYILAYLLGRPFSSSMSLNLDHEADLCQRRLRSSLHFEAYFRFATPEQ